MEQNIVYKEIWDKEFVIEQKKSDSWVMGDYHYHDHYEIYLTMTNNIKIFVDGKLYQANRGSLLLFNHLDLHRVVIPLNVEYERYVVSFRPEYINSFSLPDVDLLDCFLNRDTDFCHMINLNEEQLSYLIALFHKALTHYNIPSYGSNLYIKIILTEILLYINPLCNTISLLNKDSKSYMQIQPVLKLIHENLSKPLLVEKISAEFFLSSHHLEFLFKNVTGMSINKYINYRRILKAIELLKKGLSVANVAESVGFNSTAHFIRTFRKSLEITPKQYAKNYFLNLNRELKK